MTIDVETHLEAIWSRWETGSLEWFKNEVEVLSDALQAVIAEQTATIEGHEGSLRRQSQQIDVLKLNLQESYETVGRLHKQIKKLQGLDDDDEPEVTQH